MKKWLLILLITTNCTGFMESNKDKNHLKNSTSPYLRQHADNPVNWYPWGQEALDRAKAENKPILLSIGYSSCHWCHVMAHESFEDTAVAKVMNTHFINIKLDREERPDIDQIYMDAVQGMGLRGGWPLNVFITPDQKPFYGGTYFPKEQWLNLLEGVHNAYTNNYDKLEASATQFADALQASEARKYGLGNNPSHLNMGAFNTAFVGIAKKFDTTWGGMDKAPKFPMPCVWEYVAHYGELSQNKDALSHFEFTLDKMAMGGIYDQIGGGFSRYAVDGEWHVPHFEKMLYDNGQLLSLYAIGYQLFKKPEYLTVISETAAWLRREMKDENGGFYSALDADSEGVEGKFYVWSFEEAQKIAGDHFSFIAEYYDISAEGNWESSNVLRRLESNEHLMAELHLTADSLNAQVQEFKEKALAYRSQRIRPGLDDKLLAGWNGLALHGLSRAYRATGSKDLLDLAKDNVRFIEKQLLDGQLLLRMQGSTTSGFLEDYAAVIQGFISYYEASFDEHYLQLARELTQQVIADFYDPKEKLFFFTSSKAEQLIARKKEIFDNVIPSSNSIMAHNLYLLGSYFDLEEMRQMAIDMIQMINPLLEKEPEYLSNWATTSLMMAKPTLEIIIVGPEYELYARQLDQLYLPNSILMAAETASDLPLMQNKTAQGGQTTIYVCFEKSCRRPTQSIDEAIKEIESFKD